MKAFAFVSKSRVYCKNYQLCKIFLEVLKMAKYEKEGYCPFDTVNSALHLEGSDRRLVGLWSLIGPSVVCIDEPNGLQVDYNAVINMFSDDHIAFPLMEKIVRYNANAKKIAVKQIRYDDRGKQYYSDIQRILTNASNPQLVMQIGSCYIAIITAVDYGIDLYFWDMKYCEYK